MMKKRAANADPHLLFKQPPFWKAITKLNKPITTDKIIKVFSNTSF